MSKAKKEFPGSRQSKRNARSRVSNPRSRPLGHGHHIREFVIYLDDVDYLAKKFRGKYKLDLRAIKGGKKTPCKSNRCANFKNLEEHLLDWEEELNEKSKDQPIIRVENLVDDCFPPKDFEFVLESVSSDKIQKMFDKSYLVGCDCRRCSPKCCSCPSLSGGKFAYDRTKKVLLDPGMPIFECNQTCLCTLGCPNRVIQQGRTVKVMIFRTSDGRGWGVKTLENIPKNQFVVEYIGEIIRSEEAERRGRKYDAAQQTYLFDLDYTDDNAAFTIDACRYGNVSHFINHSCDPNLRVYGVFVDSLDARLPRIGLFATRDIPAGEELAFDYLMTSEDNNNSETGSPITPSKHRKNGPALKRFLCACGASCCRKYLF